MASYELEIEPIATMRATGRIGSASRVSRGRTYMIEASWECGVVKFRAFTDGNQCRFSTDVKPEHDRLLRDCRKLFETPALTTAT